MDSMSGGSIRSYSWADAQHLKEFIINNTKYYTKRGPIYTKATWFDREEDNMHRPGDLFFLCTGEGANNGWARHVLVITDQGTRDTAKYCAHSLNVKDEPLNKKLDNNLYDKACGFNLKYRY